MGEPTLQEIQQTQGTRLSEKAPWETYDSEMDYDPEITAELEAAIEEYALNVHENSSQQNKEELCRQKELNNEMAKEYQWLSPEEYKDEAQRKGHIRHSSEFITLLRRAGVDCWYRDHPQVGKVTLVIKRPGLEPEVGCWVQLGYMPELSIMSFDDHGVPLAEKYRGWRTCLLQLILKSAITEETADKYFGKPNVTEAFHRYNSTLQSFRNIGGRLDE